MVIANSEKKICEYMVRNPLCAYEWQPISFIRQIMLENSFSHIPFFWREKWHVISDLDVVKIHHKGKDKLASTLECCIESKDIDPRKARVVSPDKPVWDVLKCADDKGFAETECSPQKGPVCDVLKCAGDQAWPVLVNRCDCKELLGIVTPYDLM